jgi:hypothetical protein
VVRSGRVNETRQLLAVDSLLKVAIKKGILHVRWRGQTREAARLKTVRMVAGMTTRLKVSS